MGKIIQFPTGKILSDTDNLDNYKEETVESLSTKLTDISSKVLLAVEESIELISKEEEWLQEFDIRIEDYAESKDAFVILNAIYACLARYSGLSHILQEDLDGLYLKLKLQQELNDDIT